MSRRLGLGCLGIIALAIAIAVIATVTGGGGKSVSTTGATSAVTLATAASSSSASASESSATVNLTAMESISSSTSAPSTLAAVATSVTTFSRISSLAVSQPATASSDGQGITFGKPIAIPDIGAAVMVINGSAEVKSFTVKATYKVGNTIAATAAGAVNDLRPGEKRPVSLLATQPIPAKYDSVRVDVDTLVRQRDMG